MRTRVAGYADRQLSDFARRLWREWRRMALPANASSPSCVLAVSGGADSTALLLAFDELVRTARIATQIIVAHMDHGLRGERGAADARWVAALSNKLGYQYVGDRVSLGEIRSGNTEQAARIARYDFLHQTALDHHARLVATAHTLDDQAETVLLSLLRGSGSDGLRGMESVRPLDDRSADASDENRVADDAAQARSSGPPLLLVRPLLGWARRADTVAYCRERGARFRLDSMNNDTNYARVRARRKLIPLLESFNPRAVEAITRAAALLRDDSVVLQIAAARLLAEASVDDRTLRVAVLSDAPAALRRRALRQWLAAAKGNLRRIGLAHLISVENLLRGEQGGRFVELPGDLKIERRRGNIHLMFKKVEKQTARP